MMDERKKGKIKKIRSTHCSWRIHIVNSETADVLHESWIDVTADGTAHINRAKRAFVLN